MQGKDVQTRTIWADGYMYHVEWFRFPDGKIEHHSYIEIIDTKEVILKASSHPTIGEQTLIVEGHETEATNALCKFFNKLLHEII